MNTVSCDHLQKLRFQNTIPAVHYIAILAFKFCINFISYMPFILGIRVGQYYDIIVYRDIKVSR